MPAQNCQSKIAEGLYGQAKLKKAKKLDPAVFRVGDRVKIVSPYKFVRCGYPYDKKYAIEHLISREEKQSIARLLGFQGRINLLESCDGGYVDEFFGDDEVFGNSYLQILDRLAYFKLTKYGFGGNMRQIFDERDENLMENEYIVSSKRIVQTGVRTSGSSYGEDYEYEPPYLSNMKAHVILLVHKISAYFETPFEIEAKNCQKIIDYK